MKIILGILKPDSGTVRVDGIDVVEKPVEARRVIGYVPENPCLYEYLTTAEFLDFVGIAYGVEPEARRERVNEFLKALQMEDRINEVMSGFSMGMRQKVAITAALIHKPKVLVLDEALNGLDPRSAKIVKDLLHRMAQQGVAILFSTHVLEIAEAICDQVTIMNEGRVLAEGSLQELRIKAGLPGSSLEQAFLKLTASEDISKVVEALTL